MYSQVARIRDSTNHNLYGDCACTHDIPVVEEKILPWVGNNLNPYPPKSTSDRISIHKFAAILATWELEARISSKATMSEMWEASRNHWIKIRVDHSLPTEDDGTIQNFLRPLDDDARKVMYDGTIGAYVKILTEGKLPEPTHGPYSTVGKEKLKLKQQKVLAKEQVAAIEQAQREKNKEEEKEETEGLEEGRAWSRKEKWWPW